MEHKMTCPHCDSTAVEPAGVDGVFICNTCGDFFDDEDFEAYEILEKYQRKNRREMLRS